MTIDVKISVPSARRVQQRLESSGRRLPIVMKRIIEWGADLVVEKAKQNLGSKAKSGTGLLAGSLWSSKAKRSRGGLKAEVGWGYAYGAVLEWGPETATTGWEITPRPDSGAKVLRWPTTTGAKFALKKGRKTSKAFQGQVAYAKRVWHPWRDSMRRPHYEDAVNTVWPKVIARIPDAIEESLE